MNFLLLVILSLYLTSSVGGHARLVQPASRASMWRYGYNTPKDYEDNEGFCGGFSVQWDQNGGRCGLCGDAYNGPRGHEAGGQYATGQIVATYSPGQLVEVSVEVTANHGGQFRFSVCPGEQGGDPSQLCLDRSLLTVTETGTTSFPLTDRRTGLHNLTLQLPADLTCSHCVLQWTWTCANSWGLCDSSDRGALGCGPQETFRACADIAILNPQFSILQNNNNRKHKPHTPHKRPSKVGRVTQQPVKAEDVMSNTIEDKPRLRICEGSGLFRGNKGMSRWCNTNCNFSPPFCPPSHCRCTTAAAML